MKNTARTVFVGLSGGVDSSVAALRLKKQGHNVVGVFIKVWHPDFLECNWEEERLDAMRVAAALEIPFLTCDAENAYKQDVADYFISEYQKGKTPNPDVMCNKYVKFGAFLEFARAHGADCIATGHYARVEEHDGLFELHRGKDVNKDQSYFLWSLTQEQLKLVLLPIGDSTKDVIRAEAQRAGLSTAAKKDSQGICFLGHVDIADFLSHYITLQKGAVLDESGQTIGEHAGALIYTTGQRHGFTITKKTPDSKPLYVTHRDLQMNTITVSPQKPAVAPSATLTLQGCNFISGVPKEGEELSIQTRYRQKPVAAKVVSVTQDTLVLAYTQGAEESSNGQSCVLYDAMRCIGGGIIS